MPLNRHRIQRVQLSCSLQKLASITYSNIHTCGCCDVEKFAHRNTHATNREIGPVNEKSEQICGKSATYMQTRGVSVRWMSASLRRMDVSDPVVLVLNFRVEFGESLRVMRRHTIASRFNNLLQTILRLPFFFLLFWFFRLFSSIRWNVKLVWHVHVLSYHKWAK